MAPPAAVDPQGDEAKAAAFQAAYESFRAEAFAESLAGFSALAQQDPQAGEVWLAVAHSAFAAGRFDVAARAVTQVAKLGGFPRGYEFDPALLYARPEAFPALFQGLERHLATQPQDVDARLVIAWLLTSQGRRLEAQEQIQQVLTLRPGDEAAPALALALLPAAPSMESAAD